METKLEPRTLLPLSLATAQSLSFQVTSPAEIFGQELSPNLHYHLQGPIHTAISTYGGTTVKFTSELPDEFKVSPITLSNVPLNIHHAQPNRLLILGPKNCGKSTLAHTLAAYTNKTDSMGYLINLDPHLPHISIPSQLSITPLNAPLVPIGPLFADSSATSFTNSLLPPTNPYIESYGFDQPSSNTSLYVSVIASLASQFHTKHKIHPGRTIIDTPPLTIADHQIISEIISQFSPSHIVVIDAPRFSTDLQKKLTNLPPIINIEKLPGVVDKDGKYERYIQQSSIRAYFYGLPDLVSNSNQISKENSLNPFTLSLSISDLVYRRPFEKLSLPTEDSDKTEEKPDYEILANPGEMDLVNTVLAFIGEQGETRGFGYVQSVKGNKIRLLVPMPGLMTKDVIITEMRYIE
ncbi:cleavage polyadenylation factor subunit [Martiniozyma asiatica (nom. inval.)]|nr:cleavage polyadenylation factor subunit [Martiniozyma asiatica]